MEALDKIGIRYEMDTRSEKIGYKIREAQVKKINYMLVIGDNEVEEGNASVRCRKRGDIGKMSIEELCEMLKKEVAEKTIL